MKSAILAVNKPKGISSNAVLQIIRRGLGRATKIGHAGTLDPLAEGVLVVGIGREATKQLDSIVQKDKAYTAEITFGVTSTTDDEEGEKTESVVTTFPTAEDLRGVLTTFVGNIMQIPPIYSAIKIGGKEAYKHARGGKIPEMVARPARVDSIELLTYTWPKATIRVTTGKGVYIRALARDIGEQLGVGGYMSALTRTRVGTYHIEDALSPEDVIAQYGGEFGDDENGGSIEV